MIKVPINHKTGGLLAQSLLSNIHVTVFTPEDFSRRPPSAFKI